MAGALLLLMRVGYSIPATRPMRVSRSITFSQLIYDVHRMITVDPFHFRIKLSMKYSYNTMASYIEEHVHITDDDSLQYMLDLSTLGCLYLYVDDDMAHGDDPHSYPSSRRASEQWLLRTKQGRLHIMVTDMDHCIVRKQHGACMGVNTTRLDDVISGDWDHYITSVTEEDVVWGSNVATESVFQRYHGENTMYATNVQEPDDLLGDSARNVTSSEHSIERSVGEEDVDEMRTATLNEPTRSHLPYDPVMREIPQFLNTVFKEQVPDSYGLPPVDEKASIILKDRKFFQKLFSKPRKN
ncbi:hypothetical protein F511_01999 [Dorcoceras hygrometricum]|uniref:Uncharacterized protein n=1 Tax=Dorcoceras hygrometricum TaxID=472368 RepID=A0A2Z7A3Y0_9LAMI|nr:hypothetical protein F511_01999 [Dorcoceras hygrometricum]